jgi:hypothetical protein
MTQPSVIRCRLAHCVHVLGPAFLFAMPTVAAAQIHPVVGEVIHQWNFVQVHAGTNTPVANQNGLLEPGEGLRMELTISFTPEVGTLVNWGSYPPPGSGTVAGLATVFFELENNGDASGQWSHRSIAPGWIGSTGIPQPSGALSHLQIGQVANSAAPANPANPIENVWQGVWTPDSYTPRTVTWRREPPPAALFPYGSLFYQYGIDPNNNGPLYRSLPVWTPAYSLPVTIIPAPGAAITTLAGALLLARRRR